MFNSINRNPFHKIESALSAGSDGQHKQQDQQQDEGKKYLEEDEKDEVKIGGRPILTEDDILFMVKEYIENLKNENSGNEKVISKLDKFLSKFDVKKFMKNNPNITASDFHMIMYNETAGLVN